jgi:hypothetical protein
VPATTRPEPTIETLTLAAFFDEPRRRGGKDVGFGDRWQGTVRSAVTVAAKGALDDAGIALPVPEHTVRLVAEEEPPGQTPALSTWSIEERR